MNRSLLYMVLGISLTGCSPNTAPIGSEDEPSQASQPGIPSDTPQQRVGRLSVQYPYQFNLNEAESANMSNGLPAEAQEPLRSLNSYTSQPTCGLGEARLVVGQFVSGYPMNIDVAASETSKKISALEGISNPQTSVKTLTVSGHPARRISYQAGRRGGVIAAEVLIIADMQSSTFWQLQFLSGAKSGGYPKLTSSRSCADEILDTASVAP